LSKGADQLTVAEPFPGDARTEVGGDGTVDGVTAAEAEEAGPVPTALVAVTVTV
jgi:hypothetical protein